MSVTTSEPAAKAAAAAVTEPPQSIPGQTPQPPTANGKSGEKSGNGQAATKPVHALPSVTIRFAGDSGDGMQLAGTQFTDTSALVGNDISTLPDFPAEIRAPAGTLAGVSGFQIHFSSTDIYTRSEERRVGKECRSRWSADQ